MQERWGHDPVDRRGQEAHRGLAFKSPDISAQKDDEDLFSVCCHFTWEALLFQSK